MILRRVNLSRGRLVQTAEATTNYTVPQAMQETAGDSKPEEDKIITNCFQG